MESPLDHSVELTNQTFAALDELNSAMGDHGIWLKVLIRGLLTQEAAKTEDIAADAHRLCSFGHWYDRQGRSLFKDDPLFGDLEDRHQALHDAARLVLQRQAKGESLVSTEYDRFMDLAISFQTEARQFQYALLQRVCAVDQLTGAGNRYAMFQRLIQEKERAGRTSEYCVIAIMDLDHFKNINDRYGHVAGDVVLKDIVQFTSRAIRKYDAIFRYGGEEFLICLPNTDLKTAEKRMNRLREDISEHEIDIGQEHSLRLNASFGLGYLRPGFPIQDSIQQADEALLKAKNSGRNRVEIATSD